ncbi:MAG TPA: amidohydrolase family protein [Armatimonadota bacterium]|nr:amidohydrolase family protein [Armatimonadota bacterium]
MAIDIRVNFSEHDGLGRPFGVEGVLKAMQKHNIERAVLVPCMAVDSDFRLGNKELFDAIKSEDRLFGYLAVNPNYPDESIRLMRSAMSSPKFLAVALFQGASTPYPNTDDYREILNAHRRFAKPVFLHTPHAEAVAAAEQMAAEFPGIKFVFGSMGGDEWKRAMTSSPLLNVLLETSGSFDAEKIEEAVEHFGAHRVLYGSNLPFSDPASMLALIQSSELSEDSMEGILGGNAKRLFAMETGAPEQPPEEQSSS